MFIDCSCIPLGLNDLDIEGEWLVERQALWVVPPALKEIIKGESALDESWDTTAYIDPASQDVFIFKLEDKHILTSWINIGCCIQLVRMCLFSS